MKAAASAEKHNHHRPNYRPRGDLGTTPGITNRIQRGFPAEYLAPVGQDTSKKGSVLPVAHLVPVDA